MFPAWSGAGAKGCPLAARWSPTAAGQVPLPRRERSHREQCGQHARRLLVLLQVTAGGRALPGGGAVRTEPLSARGDRVTPPWSPGAAGRPPHPPVSGARAFWGVSLSFAVQPPPTLLVLCLYCMELKLTSTWALASRGTGGTHTHWPLLLLGPGAKPTPGGVAATQPLTPDFAPWARHRLFPCLGVSPCTGDRRGHRALGKWAEGLEGGPADAESLPGCTCLAGDEAFPASALCHSHENPPSDGEIRWKMTTVGGGVRGRQQGAVCELAGQQAPETASRGIWARRLEARPGLAH